MRGFGTKPRLIPKEHLPAVRFRLAKTCKPHGFSCSRRMTLPTTKSDKSRPHLRAAVFPVRLDILRSFSG
jgi:hypothetical protein